MEQISEAEKKRRKAESYFYRFSLKLSLNKDKDLIEWLLKKTSINNYLRRIIREDMNRTHRAMKMNPDMEETE